MTKLKTSPYYPHCEFCFNLVTDGRELPRCARCKQARYCDATCQKAAWQDHKPECSVNVAAREFAANRSKELKSRLPPGFDLPRSMNPELIVDDLRKWTDLHRPTLHWAMIQALQLMNSWARVYTHAVVFHVDRRPEEDGDTLKPAARFYITQVMIPTIQELIDGEKDIGNSGMVNYVERVMANNMNPKEPVMIPLSVLVAPSIKQSFHILLPKANKPSSARINPNWETVLKEQVALGEASAITKENLSEDT